MLLFFGLFSFASSVSAEEVSTTTLQQASSTPKQATSTPVSVPEVTVATTTETVVINDPIVVATSSVSTSTVPEDISPEITNPTVPIDVIPLEVIAPTPPPVLLDSATAPSKVTIRVIMPDGTPPSFPVYVTFVGVGNKNFGGKTNTDGVVAVTIPSGRYYTDLLVVNTEYVQGEDGPSFFLEANDQRDLGVIKLVPKSESTSRSLADTSLEKDISAQAESTTGVGKVLFLIVKLLMQILDEVRIIAQK
jgi:secreted PhoX family phosphatase